MNSGNDIELDVNEVIQGFSFRLAEKESTIVLQEAQINALRKKIAELEASGGSEA